MGKKEVYGLGLFSVTGQEAMSTNWITWNSIWTLKRFLVLGFCSVVFGFFSTMGAVNHLNSLRREVVASRPFEIIKTNETRSWAASSTWLSCELGHRLGDFSPNELDGPFLPWGFRDPVVQVSSILPSKLSLNTEEIWGFAKENCPSKC